MEKIIINSYGDAIALNTETNEIREKIDGLSYDTVIKAHEDAQVITKNEIVNVNKGEWIITVHSWGDKGPRAKAIVISDPATIHDLDEWKKELDAQTVLANEKVNEAV